MKNMLIQPTMDELINDFKTVDFTILNAGEFPAPHSGLVKGIDPKSKCSVVINMSEKKMIILGT